MLVVLIVLTPIGVNLGWPDWLNALLLFATIALLLIAGQTIIFLLRIVAAERREGRHRPMAAARSATVGELEDAAGPGAEDTLATSAPEEPAAARDGDGHADEPAPGPGAPAGVPGSERVRE
jgi:hypothetical protein